MVKTVITIVAFILIWACMLAIAALALMGVGALIAYAFNYPPAAIGYLQSVALVILIAVISGLLGRG